MLLFAALQLAVPALASGIDDVTILTSKVVPSPDRPNAPSTNMQLFKAQFAMLLHIAHISTPSPLPPELRPSHQRPSSRAGRVLRAMVRPLQDACP